MHVNLAITIKISLLEKCINLSIRNFLPAAEFIICLISSLSITPSPFMSNLWKALLASETLPNVIPTDMKDVDDTEVKEDFVTVVCEKDEDEDCTDIVVWENPDEGTITARNSSISISPSPLVSPSLKMASTSVLLSLLPPITAELISCLLIRPSPLMSILLNEAAAPSLPLKTWAILNTTAPAEGHKTPMNSSISISPSPFASPSLKMASTS